MLLVDQLAEKHISDAIDNGELDNLPGAGKPFQLEDDSMVPESLRAGYRLLKNAGFLPPEMKLRKQIVTLEQLLAEAYQPDEFAALSHRLQILINRLNAANGDCGIWQETYYAKKLQTRRLEKI